MLDLLKLKTFQVAAATSNFTRAAAELGYCQSKVTTHIQALERELGVPLFDRAGRNVILTEAGRRALEYANRLIALAEEAKTGVERSQELNDPISVGASEAIATYRERVRSDTLTAKAVIVKSPDCEFITAGEAASTQVINLFLVVDHGMFREGLAGVLEREPGFKVVGVFGSSAEALAALNEIGAPIVLLDVDPVQERALDFVLKCKERGFKGQVLVVTASTSGQEAVQLLQAGVAGILYKHHSTAELCKTIRQVAAGEVYLERECFDALYRPADPAKTQNRSPLTEQDRVVLRYVSQGLSNRDISVRLQISESGVKSSLRQLFDKLGVRTRAQLVKIALEQYRDQL